MLRLVLVLAALVLAAEPLTETEWAELRAGNVVVHADTSGTDTISTGYVLVDKPSSPLWGDVLDLQARIPENGTLRGIEEYRRVSPYEWYVAVDMEVFGFDVRFTNHWTCKDNTCAYTLDPARPNDLTLCDGYFKIDEMGGKSLLTYYSRSRHEVTVPGWVRRWLAIDAVQNLLRKMKARAERA